METIVGKTIYVVTDGWKTPLNSDDSNSIRGVYSTIVGALQKFLECQKGIITDWGDRFNFPKENVNPYKEGELPNSWVVETSTSREYEVHDEEYDFYYHVEIEEHKIEK